MKLSPCKTKKYVRFGALGVMSMKTAVFWDVITCSLFFWTLLSSKLQCPIPKDSHLHSEAYNEMGCELKSIYWKYMQNLPNIENIQNNGNNDM
jgi:hypothetical protein